MKEHKLYTVVANYKEVNYFYKREKPDVNGNSRFRVFIIDGDGLVYESILKCYEYEIEDDVISFCVCEL